MRTLPCVAGLIVLLGAASPQIVLPQSISPADLSLTEIASLANSDPVTAIARIDTALASLGPGNPRVTFDLFELKADLLVGLGRDDQAAPLYTDLGRFAATRRDVLERDPVAIFEKAATIYASAQQWQSARDVVLLILEEQRDGGQSGDVLAATLDRLADLSTRAGLAEDASAYSIAAETARALIGSEPSRSTGEGAYRAVEVFYATDRAQSGDPTPSEFYGYGRGKLELGIATVTIPDIHEPGIVEAPSIWRLEFGPNSARHVVLQSVVPVEKEAFYDALNGKLKDNGNSEAFVFVHGYNVKFDQAAKRAAQIAYDMNFPGVPILYSWPSRGSTVGYIPDTAVVRLSGRRLTGFLEELVDRTGSRTIHIVAHSMGNRALTDALELLALRRDVGPGDAPMFDQVLFAAPDVDADLFAEMLPTIRPLAKRLTLYASQKDWALAASRQLHGDAPRAGQGGVDMLADRNIDSVDMSELGEDMLAHSYFADDSSALADMMALFWRNAAPSQRCGLENTVAEAGIVPVWLYRAGQCADRKLVEVFANMQRENVNDLVAANRVLEQTVQDPQTARELSPVVLKLLGN